MMPLHQSNKSSKGQNEMNSLPIRASHNCWSSFINAINSVSKSNSTRFKMYFRSSSKSPFVAHFQSACGRKLVRKLHVHKAGVGETPSLLQTPREKCKETDTSKYVCNVLHAALVCCLCYLKACVQRFVIRLPCLPLQSTKGVYRNVKHLLLRIIPLRMFAWCLFICVCAMRWGEKRSKAEELKV